MAGILGDTRTRADGVASEYTATISPVLVNQLRLGWTGRRLERVAMRSGAGLESVLPTYEVVGFQQLGPAAGANAEMGTAVLQVAESMAGGLPIDFWTIDLRSALIALGEVSGDEVRHWSCLLPVLAALAERVGRAVRPHCCQVAVP